MNKMKNAKKGELRIIGGKWKGKKIYFDLSNELRPTPDRAKEAVSYTHLRAHETR